MYTLIQIAVMFDARPNDVLEASGRHITEFEQAAIDAGTTADRYRLIPLIDDTELPRIAAELDVITSSR
ncbi:hypothetical protein [Rhodococcus pyridinivorans]|uniref:Uncharacterized protein n=1 Tax=Rhodococcus pyridinivorans TaxID=103816 RepID=A0A7M2XJR9_9NOCA|nr:hypothetical protein [Rhodococcus pyridinivorans]QOV97582.1 hypothetical protein INP59_16795 [Rhodococcus pyridinivorans]